MSTGTGCKQVTDFWGDAVVVGTFRVTCAPEEGVAALDHGGRYLR